MMLNLIFPHFPRKQLMSMNKIVYHFGGGTADGDGSMKPLLGGKGTQQPPVGQADRWCKCQRIMELWRVSVGIKRNDEHHISDDVSSPGYLCLL